MGAAKLEKIEKIEITEDEEEERLCGHCGGDMGQIRLGDEVAWKCFDCGYAEWY